MKHFFFFLFCLLSSESYAQPGALDPSFGGGDGFVTLNFSNESANARAVAVLPDGKVLAGGNTHSAFCLARFTVSGALDSTFGANGTAAFDFPLALSDMVVQPDGKILALGFTGLQVTRFHADGKPDLDFGDKGTAGVALASTIGEAIALQSDGKILIAGAADFAGGNYDFALARLTPGGTLDNTFGTNGYVSMDFFGSGDGILSLAVQPDGKIIALGSAYNDTNKADFALLRYLPNGTLDNTFGSGGKVLTEFNPGDSEFPCTVLLQADGKIVAVGYSYEHPLIARYQADGSLDSGFGNGGKVIVNTGVLSDVLTSAALRPDGKIVMAGALNFSPKLALLQYMPDGSPDNSFGTNGLLLTNQATDNIFGPDLALSPAGTIHLAVPGEINPPVFTVHRYTPGGIPDASFSGDGVATAYLDAGDDLPSCLAVQSDGRVLLGGNMVRNGDQGCLLARFGADGALDMSFSADGLFPFGLISSSEYLADIALQSNGKITIVANTFGTGGSRIILLRLKQNGTLDSTFNNTGVKIFNTPYDQANAVAIQPDGKIVVAGIRGLNSPIARDFLLLRLNADGTTDNGFGASGTVVTDFFVQNDGCVDVALQPDGKIVAAGYAELTNIPNIGAMARYNANGTLDNSFGSNGKVLVAGAGGTPITFDNLLLQPDGKMLVSGISQTGGITNYALYRFEGNGAADTDFGDSSLVEGKLVIDNQVIEGIALQPDGKILMACTEFDDDATTTDFILRRLNTDGSPDTGFGDNGLVATSLEHPVNLSLDIAYLPETPSSGKILCSGIAAGVAYNADFAVARYFSGPVLSTNEPGKAPVFSIQPNPASDFIEIKTDEDAGAARLISLYDSNGRLLRSARFENTLRWDVEDLLAGVYWIHIQGVGGSRMRQFVKQ